LIGYFGENTMKTVIFKTENALFKFSKKTVKERLIGNQSEYDLKEVTQLLELISTDSDETILSSIRYHYFGYVAVNLIGSGMGTVSCQICGKIFDTDQLKEFAVGHGKSPFDINQEQKGGFMPSMFGGKGFACPEGHKLISMETWRT
jgi:hypothetical protein